MTKIWHNNRCSKSREAKSILEESNIDFEVFEYLKNDFTIEDIKDVMKKLNITDVKDMLRHKEIEYKELDIANRSQDEIIRLVVQTPKLVERPIIIQDNMAVIARPMENLTELLKKK